MIDEHNQSLFYCFVSQETMTRLIATLYFSLIFHHAFRCLPETKLEYCNMVQSDPHQILRIIPAGNRFRLQMSDMTEFCNSDSIGDGSNRLCENIQELTPLMSTSLAGNLMEFCNQDSQISQRQFHRRQELVLSIQPNITIERQGSHTTARFNPPACNML